MKLVLSAGQAIHHRSDSIASMYHHPITLMSWSEIRRDHFLGKKCSGLKYPLAPSRIESYVLFVHFLRSVSRSAIPSFLILCDVTLSLSLSLFINKINFSIAAARVRFRVGGHQADAERCAGLRASIHPCFSLLTALCTRASEGSGGARGSSLMFEDAPTGRRGAARRVAGLRG